MTHRLCTSGPWGRRDSSLRVEPNGEARPCQYRSSIWEPCVALASPIHRGGRRMLIEDRDGARPAGRSGADFHRKAADPEPGRRQLLEIVQLLQMAIADLAAGLVALPDQARVAGLQIFFPRVNERGIPAPAVDPGHPHPALEQIERRLAP